MRDQSKSTPENGARHLPAPEWKLTGAFYLALGSVMYRLSVLILLSVYGSMLAPEQFGRLEQLLAIALFASTVASLQGFEAFLPLFETNPKEAVKAGTWIMLPGFISVLLIGGITSAVATKTWSVLILAVTAHIAAAMLWQYIRNILRASGRNDQAMRYEGLQSFTILLIGVLLLFLVGSEISGVLFAIACGNLVAAATAIATSPWLRSLLSMELPSKSAATSVAFICKRLTPNVALWWCVELSDRLLLAWLSDDHTVGIYSAAARVSSLLIAATLLLYQSWQIPAIRALRLESKSSFFSSSFRTYGAFIFVGASFLAAGSQLLIVTMFGVDYLPAHRYLAVLIPAQCLAGFSYFFGIAYFSTHHSRSPIRASALAAIVGLAINATCIPFAGGIAAALSLMTAFFMMCLVRYLDARSTDALPPLPFGRMAFPAVLLTLQCTALYYGTNGAWILIAPLAITLYFRTELLEWLRSARNVVFFGDRNDA